MSAALELKIEPLTESDLPEIFRWETEDPSPWTPAQWRGELRHPAGRQWVLREPSTGRLLGYLCCRAAAGDSEVLKLAVAADFRRQGGATRLLAHACRELEAAGSTTCFLELRASNQAAQLLYEKVGFRTVGSRPGYYAHPKEDADVMMKDLFQKESFR